MTPINATFEIAAARATGFAAVRTAPVRCRLTSLSPETDRGIAVAGLLPSDRGDPPMFEAQPQAEIDALLKSDTEFRKLYQRHRELDKQVLDAELGVRAIDDTTLVKMKKEKLQAKDRLTRLYEAKLH